MKDKDNPNVPIVMCPTCRKLIRGKTQYDKILKFAEHLKKHPRKGD